MVAGEPSPPSVIGTGRTREVPDRLGRPHPHRAKSPSTPPVGAETERGVQRRSRVPGLADSIPFLTVAVVLLVYGFWLVLSSSAARIGLVPLYLPILSVGIVLLIGGLVGMLVEGERNSAWGHERNRLAVPTEEWLAMKAELAGLRLERREQGASEELAPWDEGEPRRDHPVTPSRLGGAFVPSVQDAIRELETIEKEISPRRSQPPKVRS